MILSDYYRVNNSVFKISIIYFMKMNIYCILLYFKSLNYDLTFFTIANTILFIDYWK